MKAAVLVAPNQPLEIEDLAISKPGPHEVLIRTAACGLCCAAYEPGCAGAVHSRSLVSIHARHH